MTESNARGDNVSVRAMKLPAALLTRPSRGRSRPDLLEHCLDFVGETDVANEIGGLTAALRPLRHRPSKDLLASPANHDLRAKPEKTGP
jgi:hypothetical protein